MLASRRPSLFRRFLSGALVVLFGTALLVASEPVQPAAADPLSDDAAACPPSNIWVNEGAPTMITDPGRLQEFSPTGDGPLTDVVITGDLGDIAWTADGTQLWGVSFFLDEELLRFNTTTGAVEQTRPITFPAVGTPADRESLNALSAFVKDGDPGFLTAPRQGEIVWWMPSDGVGAVTAEPWGTFPLGLGSAGDFLTLADGSVLSFAADWVNPTSPFTYLVRFDATGGAGRLVAKLDLIAWGAAQSGSNIAVASPDGTIRDLATSSVPNVEVGSLVAAPVVATQVVATTGLVYFGATSRQDAGGCIYETGYEVAKSASPVSGTTVLPGSAITYTVTVANNGQTNFTAGNPATFVDDLSGVLSNAQLVPGSIVASIGSASLVSGEIRWSGALAAGETATVSYQVTVSPAAADGAELVNVVTPETVGGV